MNWENLYLTCFLVGLVLTTLSALAGADLHVNLPFNWPHFHFSTHHHHPTAGPLNMTTILMFITWFGGAGYVIMHYRNQLVLAAFLGACVAGVAGSTIIYLSVVRVLIRDDRPLRAEDFDMVGMLGRLTMQIREGGVGELIYSQAGTRRSCGARSESGQAIPRGTEVVVMRYERGIAWVRPFADLHATVETPQAAQSQQQG
jgi:membrane protein implicated in regulation of membrane protease activity